MNRIGTTLLVVTFAALNGRALEVRESPYDRIAARNLFELHSPTPAAPTVAPVPQLPTVKLTGITTILGKPLALITVLANKSQLGESVMIAVGETINGIQVTAIDEKAAVVKIFNGAEPQVLQFEPATGSGSPPTPILVSTPPAAAKVQAALTPEEQAALIELQRIKFQQEGNPTHKILPPTGINLQ